MNPPHNKLTGRKYSSQPNTGIPLALEILEDKDAHRNDILSSTCYLGYRALDDTYRDVDYIWEKIQYCRNWSLTIAPPDNDWFRTRWIVSYLILSIYFRIYIRKEPMPLDLITEICDPKYAISHPPQFVNILRGCALGAANEVFCKNTEGMQKYLSIGIDCYKKSVSNYIINPERPDHIVYESGEAVEALNVILELKYADSRTYPKFIESKWHSKVAQESRGPFYKSLIGVYNLNLGKK